ncbi:hypothetical protein Sjap_000567 [Stephania japonica]|uniref:ADP/ATP translocase n=1 Tax=Stephania japonica TaxID=461633 RepID=A0AAP0KIB2_9MAGN
MCSSSPFICQNRQSCAICSLITIAHNLYRSDHKWCWSCILPHAIDTVCRRMMMTSGEAVNKYKSSLDAFNQILKNEGAKSLFKGAGANILPAVADKLQLIVFGKKYGSTNHDMTSQ